MQAIAPVAGRGVRAGVEAVAEVAAAAVEVEADPAAAAESGLRVVRTERGRGHRLQRAADRQVERGLGRGRQREGHHRPEQNGRARAHVPSPAAGTAARRRPRPHPCRRRRPRGCPASRPRPPRHPPHAPRPWPLPRRPPRPIAAEVPPRASAALECRQVVLQRGPAVVLERALHVVGQRPAREEAVVERDVRASRTRARPHRRPRRMVAAAGRLPRPRRRHGEGAGHQQLLREESA